jgi:hypothetical protein
MRGNDLSGQVKKSGRSVRRAWLLGCWLAADIEASASSRAEIGALIHRKSELLAWTLLGYVAVHTSSLWDEGAVERE